ncbi:MAG: NUDIX hydrolase [Chloroflexota bacterium]
MYITTNGIVVNDKNQILLIRRNDSRTVAPPGGGMDLGELPPEGAAREVFEETGITVKTQKLAAVYYWPNEPYPFLTFSFLCEPLHGELRTSNESPQVGYYNIQRLPLLLLPFHRHRVKTGLKQRHTAVPYWGVQHMTFYEDLGKRFLGSVVYPYWRWQARRRNIDMTNYGFVKWKTGAFCIIQNKDGAVLWVKRTDYDAWNLPGGGGLEMEPPWETAVRETQEETGQSVNLTNLAGIYLYRDKNHAIFVFTAEIQSGSLTTGPEAADFAYLKPNEEFPNCIPQHLERVADAIKTPNETTFRFQSSLVKLAGKKREDRREKRS